MGPPDSQKTRAIDTKEWLAVGGLLLVAAAIRFVGLDAHSLNIDEAYSWNAAHSPWGTLIGTVSDVHPPVYYSILKPLLSLGDAEWILRLPSAIFGVAGCGLAWYIGRRFGDRQVALAALALMAVSHGHIEQSLNARNYALLMLELELCLAAMLFALEQPERRRWVAAYAAGMLLVLYTHVIGLFYLVPVGLCGVWLAWRRRRESRLWSRLLLAQLLCGLLWLPWIARMPLRPHVFRWVDVLDPVEQLTTGLGMALSNHAALTFCVCVVAVVGTLLAIRRSAGPLAWLSLMVVVGAPALMLVVTPIRPVLIARVVIPVLPALALGVGLALSHAPGRVAGVLARLVLVGQLAHAVAAPRTVEPWSPDWRSAYRQVAHIGPVDRLLLCPFWADHATSYYVDTFAIDAPHFGWPAGEASENAVLIPRPPAALRPEMQTSMTEDAPELKHVSLADTLREADSVTLVGWPLACGGDAGVRDRQDQIVAFGFEVDRDAALALPYLHVVHLTRPGSRSEAQ